MRLHNTCSIRKESPSRMTGFWGRLTLSSIGAGIFPCCSSCTFRIRSFSTNGVCWKLIPLSMRDISRISLMVTRRDWLFSLIRSIAICRSSADKSSDSASKLLKPTIAFSGVRISWLILARNKVLFSSEIFASCSKACNSFCLFFKLSISEHRPNGCLR